MAARDIMPWDAPLGGTVKAITHDLLAAQTFDEGELVLIDANGMLATIGDDTTPDVSIHLECVGVACDPAQGMASDADGTTNAGFAPRGVWIFSYEQNWITPNFSVAGAAFNDALFAHVRVGDACGVTSIGGVHGIEMAGDHLQFRVVQVLDANRQPIRDLTSDATYVVFRREHDTEYGDQS